MPIAQKSMQVRLIQGVKDRISTAADTGSSETGGHFTWSLLISTVITAIKHSAIVCCYSTLTQCRIANGAMLCRTTP